MHIRTQYVTVIVVSGKPCKTRSRIECDRTEKPDIEKIMKKFNANPSYGGGPRLASKVLEWLDNIESSSTSSDNEWNDAFDRMSND